MIQRLIYDLDLDRTSIRNFQHTLSLVSTLGMWPLPRNHESSRRSTDKDKGRCSGIDCDLAGKTKTMTVEQERKRCKLCSKRNGVRIKSKFIFIMPWNVHYFDR